MGCAATKRQLPTKSSEYRQTDFQLHNKILVVAGLVPTSEGVSQNLAILCRWRKNKRNVTRNGRKVQKANIPIKFQ